MSLLYPSALVRVSGSAGSGGLLRLLLSGEICRCSDFQAESGLWGAVFPDGSSTAIKTNDSVVVNDTSCGPWVVDSSLLALLLACWDLDVESVEQLLVASPDLHGKACRLPPDQIALVRQQDRELSKAESPQPEFD